MKPVRVMIVDDSVVVRRTIIEALASEPHIEIVGEASNGLEALRNVPIHRPDIVVLDLIMPQMDGLTTLHELRRFHPSLPVIIFSSCSTADAKITVEALASGAADYCPKPSASDGFMASVLTIRNDLLTKIRAIVDAHRRMTSNRSCFSFGQSAEKTKAASVIPPTTQGIVIGCSTGGPQALEYLLSAVPENTPAPIIIAQHMPATFTARLADRLNTFCALDVIEASDGINLEPGTVYICPGEGLSRIKGNFKANLLEVIPETSKIAIRPSVDELFRSAARVWQRHTCGLILTGMGTDGLKGAECILQAGGTMIAQDKDSSVVWGMPGAVVRAGLATHVRPLHQIRDDLIHLGRSSSTGSFPQISTNEISALATPPSQRHSGD